MRLRTIVILSAVGLIVLAGVVVVVIVRLGGVPAALRGEGCAVKNGSAAVDLSTEQMANAATIAAVGLRRNIPDQGIVVALATSLQESKLENLESGDRDSVGLFQQRPSQGWGTEAQLKDPRYAAGKFYTALLKVRGWEDMRVTEAAQLVQRSAYPDAYEKWADEAETLASAFTGHIPSSVVCTLVGTPSFRGAAAAQALSAGLRADWGQLTTSATTGDDGLIVTASDTQVGWQYAHWIVAHASDNGVERVRFGGQQWSAESGDWNAVDPTPSNVDANLGGGDDDVVAQVYRA